MDEDAGGGTGMEALMVRRGGRQWRGRRSPRGTADSGVPVARSRRSLMSRNALTTRDARRLHAPSWRDPRLLIGLTLVLGSVIVGARTIASFDHRTPVYAATVPLAPGQVLSLDQLTHVDVMLGAASEHYLAVGEQIPSGTVVLREVRTGEIVARTAVGGAQHVGKPVMVPVAEDAARVLSAGDRVDVWVNSRIPAPAGSRSPTYGTPVRALSQVAISRVPDLTTRRSEAGEGTVGIQVMVPAEHVEKLIAAVDQDARFTLVPSVGVVPAVDRSAGLAPGAGS